MYLIKSICFILIGALVPCIVSASDFFVTNNNASGAGSLQQAIIDLNSLGVANSKANSNTITISPSLATITLDANLPVIQKGVTIYGPNNGQVIDGNNKQYNIFSTFIASLSLNNLTLQNGLAKGGNGAVVFFDGEPSPGGGGGLGAGGGVFIDAGQTLTLVNTTITACKAQGGSGGNGGAHVVYHMVGGGGGGGASWSRTTTHGVNASGRVGGGDFYGATITTSPYSVGGSYIQEPIDDGYGGGDGGSSLAANSGGAKGGNHGGSSANSVNGAAGGYCGGGGGGGVSGVNINYGGGGGGNGGGAGVPATLGDSPGIGGGGGGYGSGGGGGLSGEVLDGGGGGGGGFGAGGSGGGGSIRTLSTDVTFSGGGGGGWGGGGGGSLRGVLSVGKGGNFGGNGGGGAGLGGGGGGGGAGAGGGVFVADGAILDFSDGPDTLLSASNITGNIAQGGARGTFYGGSINNQAGNGSFVGPDVFIFRKASIHFNVARNFTANFAINSDTAALGSDKDAGIVVNAASGTVLTLTANNMYQGPTTINSGTLSISADNNLGIVPSSPTTGQLIFNGGALSTSNSVILNSNRGITLNASGGSIVVGSGFTTTYGGIISGAGNLTVSGGGTLALTGASSIYQGSTTINSSVVSIVGDHSLGAAPVSQVATQINIVSGTLATTNNFSLNSNRGITISGNSGIAVGSGFTTTYGGIISGTGNLNVSGGGTLDLTGISSTYQGSTTINSSTLRISADTSLGAVPVSPVTTQINLVSGTLATTNNFSLNSNRGITVSGGSGIAVSSGSTITYGGILAGTGGVTVSGGGTLVLTGVQNTYDGVTTVDSSILRISDDNSLGPAPVVPVATQLTLIGATLGIDGNFSLNANRGITISGGSGIAVGSSYTATYDGVIAGTGGLTVSGEGTLVLNGTANTYSGGTNITNGTLQAGGANFPSGSGITVSSGILEFTGGNVNNITINSAGVFNVNGVANITNITNSGILNVNQQLSSTGNINSNGNINLRNIINMPGLSLTNTGSINVQGMQSLDATNFVSSGSQNYTITNTESFDSLTTNAAIDLSNGSINVSSSYIGATNSTADWDILIGTSIMTNDVTKIILPDNSALSSWSSSIIADRVKILYNGTTNFTPLPGTNTQIANVLNAMNSLSVKNTGQTSLLSTFNSITNEDAYNDALSAFQPNTSISSVLVAMQNVMFNKLENRVMSLNPRFNVTRSKLRFAMYSSGDETSDQSVWISGFGDILTQKQRDDFQAYRAKIYGLLLGAEIQPINDNICGLAIGLSNAEVTALVDTHSVTKIFGVNIMAYGAMDAMHNSFLEWAINAALNRNKGMRNFSINTTNLNIVSSYNNYALGGKINLGKNFAINDELLLAPVASVQYILSPQEGYTETGSIAALNVMNTNNTNIFTVGAGLRLEKIYNDYWLVGSRGLSAMVTYDAISTQQVVVANFVVGSNNFTMVNSPQRLALNLSADYALTVRKNTYLQLAYNLQLRNGYYDNFIAAQLRYLF